MACSICNRFKGKWDLDDDVDAQIKRGRRDHKNPSFTWCDLTDSAKVCYCCGILVSGCRGCFKQHNIEETEIVRGSVNFYYPTQFQIDNDDVETSKELSFLLKNGRRFEIEMFVEEDEYFPDSWDDCMSGLPRISSRTDSPEALALVKQWINSCIKEHELCEPPEPSILPSRVVDVGLDSGVVKLIEPNRVNDTYLCLSHCWGLAQIITTKTSTIEDRKRGIAWEDLSKTFQDAISFTRTLGFKYLWIDSLCIIQDDLRDWEIESAKMATTYSNSYLTIAATQSSNGKGGLFLETEDVKVSGQTPDGDPYCVFFRELINHHIEVINEAGFNRDNPLFSGNPTSLYYPLLTRAWVYQERMLSTRVVHFGRYEVFFECRSNVVCECDRIRIYGGSDAAIAPIIKMEHGYALLDFADNNDTDIEYVQARLWRTMIGSYTALELTKKSDRLPAIGGLAKHMARQRKTKYLAGLWEDTLSDDLLWTVVVVPKYKQKRPSPRNAPTWSWASIETAVLYWDMILYTTAESDFAEERSPYEHYSKIEKCEVNWSAVDEFGPIIGGSLTISGLVAKGVLDRRVEQRYGAEIVVYYVCFPDVELLMRADYLLELEDPSRTIPGSEVICLRMSRIQEGHADNLISLVLKQSTISPSNYERIGTLVIQATPPPVSPVAGPFEGAENQTITII